VELYADYEQQRLMAFLVSSQSYPLEAAYDLCEARGLVKEQVDRLPVRQACGHACRQTDGQSDRRAGMLANRQVGRGACVWLDQGTAGQRLTVLRGQRRAGAPGATRQADRQTSSSCMVTAGSRASGARAVRMGPSVAIGQPLLALASCRHPHLHCRLPLRLFVGAHWL
jgi:hypothetical protein